jgi:site-specific recombinase XerD
MAGVDLMTVKELLGHKTIEMTLRYAYLAPDHKMRAVNILDQIMSQNPPQEKT